MSGKNYFELCNDVLEELYYEKVDSFDELNTIAEGRRVKKMLNQALSYICNNENEAWSFRNKSTQLVLIPNKSEYDRPNGYIEYMKYSDVNIVLNYIEEYKYLPSTSRGLPMEYYISNDKINFYPVPSQTEDNKIINIEYYTDDFAEDYCGLGKPEMKLECDVPVIPARHRDILVYKVCADWRGNSRDGAYEHYDAKFKRAYRALRMDCARTLDRPKGLNIMGGYLSFKDIMLQNFYNPYSIRRSKQ